MSEEYKPINCSFYDYFEKYATLRKTVKIKIKQDSGKLQEVRTLIHDLKTESKEEFALVDGGKWIRLDKIVSIEEASELKKIKRLVCQLTYEPFQYWDVVITEPQSS